MEDKRKHLEMIQDVIKRMSSNSFMLKGWAVTLVAGIFTLAGNDMDKHYFLVAYVPVIVFWGLDAYYLLQERLYRELYNKVRTGNDKKTDFSMEATTKKFGNKKNNYCACVFSATELCFYLPLALICVGIIFITHI